MVVRHKTCQGRGSVDGIGDVCCATFYVVRPCRATKIVSRQMSVHFKRNSCDIMVSQRCCVLSDVIWTYFCHFLHCSCAKFIKTNRGCVDVGRTTTFCMTTTRFMSHNLVVQSCMTKLLSVWTHLYTHIRKVMRIKNFAKFAWKGKEELWWWRSAIKSLYLPIEGLKNLKKNFFLISNLATTFLKYYIPHLCSIERFLLFLRGKR